jgi:hypothetical protein
MGLVSGWTMSVFIDLAVRRGCAVDLADSTTTNTTTRFLSRSQLQYVTLSPSSNAVITTAMLLCILLTHSPEA